MSDGRLTVFLITVGALAWWQAGGPFATTLALVLLGAGGYLGLVFWHRALRRRAAWTRAHHRLAREGLHRIDRDWEALPAPTLGEPPPDHAYAADLDLLGRASIEQVLGPVATPAARRMLRAWLLAAATPADVRARQAAAAELAGLTDQRLELAARGRLAGHLETRQADRFMEWAEREPWLRRSGAVLWTARLLPAATLGLAGLGVAGVVDGRWWLAPVAAALMLTGRHAARLKSTFAAATPADTLRDYVAIFACARTLEARTSALLAVRDRLDGAARALERLRRLIHLADMRLSILHFVAQLVLLWDFHIVWLLERWKAAHGAHARDWLDALGETEALAALGTLSFDHPDWCWPEMATGAPRVEARALAHPMLRADRAVANDVQLGPPGRFLLVTGSNMSGKSTLLRAIGANVVLAQCGAPACAAALRLAPLRVHTSMRIRDSLAAGVSLFMAEVQRLGRIVEAAEAPDARAALYLLDEILQGTNLEEHRVGARWILTRLTTANAIGAVATHDLEVAAETPLRVAARHVHFQEEVVETETGPTLTFDYALRPGPATTRNALVIMRLAGLEAEG
ncbi:MAG: MutS-related protein [Longimicrobiales bacterium]